jgi:hypothetical protein
VVSNGPDALTLHCHEVTVRFLEKAIVPPYEGSMIRGSFKESCCPFPHDGKGCPLGERCPYGYVFEPPEATKMEYEPGETMRFGFTVVGRAAEYMPYFIYAFSKMGGSRPSTAARSGRKTSRRR